MNPDKDFACTGLTPDSEVCWHCYDVIEARPAPRCKQCPDECDIEDCDAPGCAGTRKPMTVPEGVLEPGIPLSSHDVQALVAWATAKTTAWGLAFTNAMDVARRLAIMLNPQEKFTESNTDWGPDFKPSEFYADRDPMELDKAGGYYCRHVSAMTGEGLHAKSDIAAELGARDLEIDILKREVNRWQKGEQVEGDYVPHVVGSLERHLATRICNLINDWRRAPTPKESGPMGDLLDAIETRCILDSDPKPTQREHLTSKQVDEDPAKPELSQPVIPSFLQQGIAAGLSQLHLTVDLLQGVYDNEQLDYPLWVNSVEFKTREAVGHYLHQAGLIERVSKGEAPPYEDMPAQQANYSDKCPHARGLEVERTLVLSTSHVTQREMEAITASEWTYGNDAFSVFRINHPEDEVSPLVDFLSVNGERIVGLAKSVGATHVKLDRDGPVMAGLPSFQW